MKPLNILVIGSGMYTCGRGTAGFGTIMPAIFEWKKKNAAGSVYVAGASPEGICASSKKITELGRAMGMSMPVKYFPDGSKMDNRSYLKAISEIARPACALIAVPDVLHKEVAEATIGKGMHTLVVKPLAPTVKEVKELIGIQEKKGVYCVVEFHKRLDYANMKLRDMVAAGTIGDPLYFLAEFSQRKSMPTKIFRRWVETTNIFQYLGIHYVDIVYFVAGAKPVRAMAIGQKGWLASQGIDTYDSVEATIEWEISSGRKFVSVIVTNWIDPEATSAMSDQKIKVIGTKGRIESDQKRRGMTIVTDGKGLEEPNPYFCASYGNDNDISYKGYGIDTICQFLNDVADVERGKLDVSSFEGKRPTFKDSIMQTAILEAINKSLKKSGEWIPVAV